MRLAPMRVALVAGPEAGHVFPAIALSRRLLAAGDHPVVLTGAERLDTVRAAGIDAIELAGLKVEAGDDDTDSGAKIHHRAARMAALNRPLLADLRPDLVVSDVITVCGGMAAELLGLSWVELSPHPLYLPSKALPPIGIGLAPGTGVGGRFRDTVMRALTARSIRAGDRPRATARRQIGLPAVDPGPWTAAGGMAGLAEMALEHLIPGQTLPAGSRLAVSRLGGAAVTVPSWATVGLGRQDELLAHADLVICGGGHGMLSKTLLAGVPVVVVPGGGDQWELANRVVRQGSARLIRPLTVDVLVAEVNEVLSKPSYRLAARRAAESLAGVADPVQVCHEAAD